MKSPMLEAGYEMAIGLFEAGVIDAKEMREFDALYLAALSEKATSKKINS